MRPKRGTQTNKETTATAVLSVRIQPRASKNEAVKTEEGRIKVRLTAPPVDGAANEALIRFLADTLSVAKTGVEIVSGHTSRNKVVRIDGISRDEAEHLLKEKRK